MVVHNEMKNTGLVCSSVMNDMGTLSFSSTTRFQENTLYPLNLFGLLSYSAPHLKSYFLCKLNGFINYSGIIETE